MNIDTLEMLLKTGLGQLDLQARNFGAVLSHFWSITTLKMYTVAGILWRGWTRG